MTYVVENQYFCYYSNGIGEMIRRNIPLSRIFVLSPKFLFPFLLERYSILENFTLWEKEKEASLFQYISYFNIFIFWIIFGILHPFIFYRNGSAFIYFLRIKVPVFSNLAIILIFSFYSHLFAFFISRCGLSVYTYQIFEVSNSIWDFDQFPFYFPSILLFLFPSLPIPLLSTYLPFFSTFSTFSLFFCYLNLYSAVLEIRNL